MKKACNSIELCLRMAINTGIEPVGDYHSFWLAHVFGFEEYGACVKPWNGAFMKSFCNVYFRRYKGLRKHGLTV